MFDAKKLLDALIGSSAINPALNQTDTRTITQSYDAFSTHSSGGMSDIIGSVVGQLTGQQSGPPGSVTEASGDFIAQAREYLDTPHGRNIASTVAGGLAGLLIGSRVSSRSITTAAAKLGGIALIGGLAYKAWQNWQKGEPPYAVGQHITAPPADTVFGAESASQDMALVLLRTMIAAATSDEIIDTEERARIINSLTDAGVMQEVSVFLDREFSNPASITILASAATTKEVATEIYTAARLAIEPDTPSERAFLQELSQALSLPTDLVAHIDATTSTAKESKAAAVPA